MKIYINYLEKFRALRVLRGLNLHQLINHKIWIPVISYTEARNSLKAVLDSVVENADYTLITRSLRAEMQKTPWSCCIDETNRLVYAVDANQITIIACRYHYQF